MRSPAAVSISPNLFKFKPCLVKYLESNQNLYGIACVVKFGCKLVTSIIRPHIEIAAPKIRVVRSIYILPPRLFLAVAIATSATQVCLRKVLSHINPSCPVASSGFGYKRIQCA